MLLTGFPPIATLTAALVLTFGACLSATAGAATPPPEPGRWHELPAPPIRSAFPPQEGHPAWGTIGPEAVITAWSGGAFGDGRLWVMGGGHRNYGGNEVYALNLGDARWVRVTEPSPMRCVDQGCRVADDAAPLTRHTFDGLDWLPAARRLWVGGGRLYRPDATQNGLDSWLFDPAAKRWERLPDLPFPAAVPRTAYDPVTDLLIVWGDRHLAAFDPKRRVYTRQSRQIPGLGPGSAAVDPERRLVVALAESGVWATKIGPHQPLMTPQNMAAAAAGGPPDLQRFGLAYHPKRRLFVAWDGGRSVWTLDPEGWSWTEYPNPDGPAPFAAGSNGVFGRWRYVPELDAFLGVGDADGPAWLYRLPDRPQPRPVAKRPGVIRVCPSDAFAPGCDVQAPSQAAAMARDGDLIEVAAGDYRDCAVWRADRLTIRGLPRGDGGPTQPRVRDATCEGKAIWVVKGDDTVIENVAFSGMAVPDRNGAGVRLEGRSLTLRRVLMEDGEEGLLTAVRPDGEVLIEDSVFRRLGRAGRAHGIYLSGGEYFVLRRSQVYASRDEGHEVKSRARYNLIECNLLASMDGADSYTIDLPQGGQAVVRNNVIQQGPQTVNHSAILAFGLEDDPHPEASLALVDNLFVNDAGRGGFIRYRERPKLTAVRNRFVGAGQVLPDGDELPAGNEIAPSRDDAGLPPYPDLPMPDCS